MTCMKHLLVILPIIAVVTMTVCTRTDIDRILDHHAPPKLVNEGKNIFRFDTFGDEEFWSGLLHIDKAIAGTANGGFGDGDSPNTALKVGLKVDD